MGVIGPIARKPSISDIELDKENLKARRGYTDIGMRALMAAICLQAVRDYKTGGPIERQELRTFFEGALFDYFTNGQSVSEIIAAIEKVPDNVMHMCFVADKPKVYITEEAKNKKNGKYTVYKGSKFLAGYNTIRSARLLADREGADLYEDGKFIYSPNIKLNEGGINNGRGKAKKVKT